MDVGAFVQSVTGITVSSIKRTSLQYTCFGTRVSLNELALGETAGGIIQYYELCLYDKTDPANYIRILLNGTILYQIQIVEVLQKRCLFILLLTAL